MCRVNARPSPQLILQRYAASMLKLFGQTRSRASRSLWMLEEIGIPYEHMPVRPYTESQSAEYLHIYTNGHISSLEDDGFVLWESLAINMYLAETYAGAVVAGRRQGSRACLSMEPVGSQ